MPCGLHYFSFQIGVTLATRWTCDKHMLVIKTRAGARVPEQENVILRKEENIHGGGDGDHDGERIVWW